MSESLNILVVEDSYVFRIGLEAVVKKSRHKVISCINLADGLKMIDTNVIDIKLPDGVIVDLEIPSSINDRGSQLANGAIMALEVNKLGIPVRIVTGHDLPEARSAMRTALEGIVSELPSADMVESLIKYSGYKRKDLIDDCFFVDFFDEIKKRILKQKQEIAIQISK